MTPSRRISPGLPEGQVSQTVASSPRISLSNLIDPNPRAYDTGYLAEGLEFFTKKAADRKQKAQEGARAEANQFLKKNAEAFPAALTDKELNVAIRNAARDGDIPIGLQPDFQRGLKGSIAERRLQTADVNLSQWTAGYTGLNDAGEPKPIQEVLEDINGAYDEISVEALGEGLATDPDVSGFISENEAKMRQSFVQNTFIRSLEHRMNWAMNHAQASFAQVGSQVSAPLSDEEQAGFHLVLSELYKQQIAKGIPDPSIPLVDAALVNADALKGEQGVDAALHFLDAVLDFKVDGKPLQELPDRAADLIKKRAALQSGRAEDIQREEYERGAMIRRLEGVVDEAIGDSTQLIKDGKYDEARARVLQVLEENQDYSQDTDGTIGRYLDTVLNDRRGERVIDQRIMEEASDALASGKIPENWRQQWGSNVSLEMRTNLAAAERARSETESLKQLALAPITRRIDARASDIVTTDAGSAGNQYVNSQIRSLRDETEIAANQFAQSILSDPNLTDSQRQAEVSRFEQDYDQKVVQPRVQGLISELETQRQGVEGVVTAAGTLTAQGIKEAQQGLNFLRARLDPATEERLTRTIDRANTTLAGVEADIQIGGPIFESFNRQLLDAEGNVDQTVHSTVLEVFEEIRADRDKFIQSIAVEGTIPPNAAVRELDRRISQKIQGGGNDALARVLAEQQARRTFVETLTATGSPEGRVELYLNSMSLVTAATKNEIDLFRAPASSLRQTFFGSGVIEYGSINRPARDRFVNYISSLDEAEAAEALAPWIATPADVVDGKLRLKSRRAEGFGKYEVAVIREMSAADIDWRVTPMASSKRALKESLDDIAAEGRLPEFLEKVNFDSREEFEAAQSKVFSLRFN